MRSFRGAKILNYEGMPARDVSLLYGRPHPLYPLPLGGEGEELERGALPLLDTPPEGRRGNS